MHSERVRKILVFTGLFLVGLTMAWFVGQNLFLSYLVDKVETQLHSLRDAGYMIKYDSIKLSWSESRIEIYNLQVKRSLDTMDCKPHNFIAAKYILAEGIQFIPLIMKKKLIFEKVHFDSTKLVLHEYYFTRDSLVSKGTEFSMHVNELQMPAVLLQMLSEDQCDIPFSYKSDIHVENFALSFYEDQPAFGTFDKFLASHIIIDDTLGQYTYNVKSVSINLPLKLLDIDTIRIIPHFGNYAFSRKRGFQTDRFEGVIPYVNGYGFNLSRKPDSLGITIRKLTTQLHLNAYRDKRIPDKQGYKKLPIEQLNSLPFGLKIDSLVLNKSFVRYEEFPEGGDSSGHVFFKDLFATIRNIDNTREARDSSITMLVADAALMGKGRIHLKAELPADPLRKHQVQGYLSNFELSDLNTILEPVLGIKAESGKMNKMTFLFAANSQRADGEIEMNYRDLKIISFRNKPKKGFLQRLFDHDDDKVQKAGFKTFIINNFILRTERENNKPFEIRKGNIAFDRNTSKYIFNFWWKAVGSGVKSAYKIDKLEDSKLVEALKKKDKG
jgi:hypothetical protein